VRTYPFEVTVHRTLYHLGLYIIKLWVSEQLVVELGDDNELVIKQVWGVDAAGVHPIMEKHK